MATPLEIVTSYNEALFSGLATGSFDGINQYLTPETTCLESPMLPWGGTWVGPSGFAEMFSFSGDFEIASDITHAYWADGSTVFHRMSFEVTVGGAEEPTTVTSVELYRVEGDTIASIEVFFFDPGIFAPAAA
jgi:hypothetical protein